MKEFLSRIVSLICYCGLTKDEYKQIKKEAYISNFQVWKHLHVYMLSGFVVLGLAFYLFDGISPATAVQIAMAVYFLVTSCLFLCVLKDDSIISQFVIYLTMILLLASAVLINVFRPEANAVTFVVLLVMLPMFMIDKPYFMAILEGAAVTVYLIAAYRVKSPEAYAHEALFAVFYGIFGIAVNTFYNTIRIHEFTMHRRELELVKAQKYANEKTGKLNNALRKMSESALELLGDVVEGRDAESGEHIMRVKGFTNILAKQVMADLPEYGLDDYTVDLITSTSVLHDVGKISIPDSILCKPGRLTTDEFNIMKSHCEKGCAILGKMRDRWSPDYYEMGVTICRMHHEKWDGRGYPSGLKGDEIPIAAQIVSIADIFDALTSNRVYKDAYSCEKAYEMIMNGECGAFSEKLLGCYEKCRELFAAHLNNEYEPDFGNREYELVSKTHPGDSFVVGLYDNDRTLKENLRLDEENAVMQSLSENFFYICYVDMVANEVIRFKAEPQFAQMLDSYGEDMPSNERFDKMLNSIIVAEDYAGFRAATDREKAVQKLYEVGHIYTDFRIRIADGVHYCRMKISLDRFHSDAVVIGMSLRDEQHEKEERYLKLQTELADARRAMENREKLADRLAVIDCISSEYDYVCSLNADTMKVTVYRAEDWIRDMFKNIDDIIVSPEVRAKTLKGIIYPADFEKFKEQSEHSEVVKALAAKGCYTVNYRVYLYGRLVNYQTRYNIDKNDPKRIIIGLRSLGSAE